MSSKNYGQSGVAGSLEFGKGGARVRNNSGAVEARNNADNALAIMRGAAPVGSDDLTSKDYVDAEVQRVSVGALNAVDGTSTGVGKLTFAATRVNLRHTTDHSGKIYEHTIPETELTFTDGGTEYVVAEYNGGAPRFVKETDYTTINNSDRVPIWLCWRVGTTVHQLNGDNAGLALANKIATMLTSTQAYRRAGDAGLVPSESATPNPRTVVVTGGYVFAGFNGILVGAYNSSTDLLTRATVNTGVWTYDSTALVYNNTHYNPPSGPVEAGANKWVSRWFYRSIGDVKEVFYVYGVAEHNTQAEAELEGEPSTLPNVIRQHCVLVGRAVIQHGDTSGHMDSVWETPLTHSAVINHNDTGALNTGDYQHLTAAQLATTLLLPTSWVDEQRYGIVAPATTTTIAFNDGTYQFTLGSVGATWSYWRAGVRYTVTGSKTVTLAGAPPAAGTYYIYIDATDGTLTASTVGWTLADTKVPVAIVAWDNAATPKYFLADERHSCEISRAYHREHHFADGAELVSGGTVSGYVVNEAAPAGDGDNTFAIAETVFYDEDKTVTCAVLADPTGAGGDCMTLTRTGATTYGWAWSDVPFRYTPAGYINWNNAGTLVEGASGKFYCTYLFATNFQSGGRFVNVMGRGEYATLGEALAESPGTFNWDGFPVAEAILLYKWVWATDSTYTTKGKVRIAIAPSAYMKSLVSLRNLAEDRPIRVLDDLADTAITAPLVDQILKYNGLQWVNGSASAGAGAGPGFEFYFDNTNIIAASAENTFALDTIQTAPTTDVEGTETVTVNTSTAVCKAYVTSAALGRTSIEGGPFTFHVWAGVNNTGSTTTLQASLHRVIPNAVYTVTTTGAGTSRTCTISGGSHFVAGDANASLVLAGYVQTPKGLYQITGYTSATVVTIATPAGYVNESAVAWSQWRYIGNIATTDINTTTPTYTAFEIPGVFSATACNTTDKFGVVVTGTSNRAGSTTITWTREGTARYSHITTPLGATHEQLQGLLGGAANDHYHITSVQAGHVSRLSIATGKTFTASNTLTLQATDGATLNIGTGGTLGTAAYTASTAYEASGTVSSHASLQTGVHGISITAGKTFSCSNTLTLAGTDGSTLTIGTGGTLGTAAYTASTAYEASGAVSSHASLQTGVHGISITAGKTFSCSNTLTLAGTDGSTLTIGTGGTLGTAAYTATTAYEASGAVSAHASLQTGVHGISITAAKTLTVQKSITFTSAGDLAVLTVPNATDTLMGLGAVQSVTGAKTFDSSAAKIKGSSTGVTALASANAGASDYTQTFQAVTGTVYCSGGTDVAIADGGTGVSAAPTRTIWLSAGGATLPTTSPATRETQERATNKESYDVLKFPYAANAGLANADWAFGSPDAWDASTLTLVVYYYTTSTDGTNNIVWQAKVTSIGDAENTDVAWGTVATVTAVVSGTANYLKKATISLTSIGGTSPAAGELLHLRVLRDAAHASDNTTLDAYLVGVRVEFGTNAWTD